MKAAPTFPPKHHPENNDMSRQAASTSTSSASRSTEQPLGVPPANPGHATAEVGKRSASVDLPSPSLRLWRRGRGDFRNRICRRCPIAGMEMRATLHHSSMQLGDFAKAGDETETSHPRKRLAVRHSRALKKKLPERSCGQSTGFWVCGVCQASRGRSCQEIQDAALWLVVSDAKRTKPETSPSSLSYGDWGHRRTQRGYSEHGNGWHGCLPYFHVNLHHPVS